MKADRISWYGMIAVFMICAAAIALGGCGNTVKGLGTDIVEAGDRILKKDEQPDSESKQITLWINTDPKMKEWCQKI